MILSDYVTIEEIFLVHRNFYMITYSDVDFDYQTGNKIYDLLYINNYIKDKYNPNTWVGCYIFKTKEEAQEALDWLEARILADEMSGKTV